MVITDHKVLFNRFLFLQMFNSHFDFFLLSLKIFLIFSFFYILKFVYFTMKTTLFLILYAVLLF